MSDPQPITINIDAGWLTRAWACVPKTKADFYALPGKIAGKVWNSIQWAAYHTQVWLALAAAFVAGAALSPLARPHLAAYSVPMVEAENVAPRTVTVDLRGVQQQLDRIQSDMTAFNRRANDMDARIVAVQGAIAQVIDFTNNVPAMMSGMFVLGAASPASPQPAAPGAKPKPQPAAKKPLAALPDEAAKPASVVASPPNPLDIIKGWVGQ